jgi:hypothetical protein
LDQSPGRPAPALLYILPGYQSKDKIVVSLDYNLRERIIRGTPKETMHTNSVTTGYVIRDPGELYNDRLFPVLSGTWIRERARRRLGTRK